jgi:hypothetical protein
LAKKKKCEHPFTGPELACGTLEKAVKWAIRDWINKKHRGLCVSSHLAKNVPRVLVQEPSAIETESYMRFQVLMATSIKFSLLGCSAI